MTASAPRSRWRHARRVALLLFLVVVAALLVRYVRSVSWRDVGRAIAGYDLATLSVAAALAALSYLLYAG